MNTEMMSVMVEDLSEHLVERLITRIKFVECYET